MPQPCCGHIAHADAWQFAPDDEGADAVRNFLFRCSKLVGHCRAHLWHLLTPLSEWNGSMIGHQFAPSVAPNRQVTEVQFGILSPEEIVGCWS